MSIRSKYGATFIPPQRGNPVPIPPRQVPGDPTHLLSLFLWISLFWGFRINGIVCMASRLIRVVAWSTVSFLPTGGCLWMCWVLLTRSSVDGPLGPVCLLAVVGNAAVNVELQVFERRFQFSWYIPRCLCVF